MKPPSEAGDLVMYSHGLMDRKSPPAPPPPILTASPPSEQLFFLLLLVFSAWGRGSPASVCAHGLLQQRPLSNPFSDTFSRNAHYPPHSHRRLTTHLIRRGTLTITYPRDENPTRETFGVGARIEVAAGREHEVWMGEEGCEYVIGEES